MLSEALQSCVALGASPRVQRPSSGTVFFSSWHSLKTATRNSSHKWKEPEMREQKPEEPRERCFSPTVHPSVMLLKPVRDKADKSFEKYKHYQMSDIVTINYF